MNKASISQSWDYFRQVQGIGLRAVAALPEASLDTHPIPGMRTPKELVVHLFSSMYEFPKAVRDGKVGDYDEAAIVAGIKSKADLLAFCGRMWTEGNAIVQGLTDAQIGGMVQTPWAGAMPGFVMMQITNDEFWHHRGQLYTYLRALGIEPAMLYDYEHNDAAFQPKATAKA